VGRGLSGDPGEVAYFFGAYADVDALEQRVRADDPSKGGAALLVGHVEWAPSEWLAAGGGGMLRLRQEGGARVDASLSARVAWRAFQANLELLGAHDEELQLGGHIEAWLRAGRRVGLGARGEWDPGAERGGQWAATGASAGT
jgi:hypothetical protein